jgi:hypothetical protein
MGSPRGGEVRVQDHATGLPLESSYSDGLQRGKWTVCTATLASGSLDKPDWLMTVEIADPSHGCGTGSQPPGTAPTDGYGAVSDAPTWEAPDDDTSDGWDSHPQGGVRPGSWCGDPGAYGYTSAGTRMQCQYGKGNDMRWRRAD